MSGNSPLTIVSNFLKECYELKESFTYDIDIQQESSEILGILSRIKLFISNKYNRNSVYYISIGYTGGYNRILLDKVIIGLENIEEDLSNDFKLKDRITFLLEECHKLKEV